MADVKPWWRRWDGVPPIWERSQRRALHASEVWVARVGLSVLFVLGLAGVLRGFVWSFALLANVAVHLVASPPHHRDQLLGRRQAGGSPAPDPAT